MGELVICIGFRLDRSDEFTHRSTCVAYHVLFCDQGITECVRGSRDAVKSHFFLKKNIILYYKLSVFVYNFVPIPYFKKEIQEENFQAPCIDINPDIFFSR